MDYKYIEKLVEYSKDGHNESKEQLVKEFTPYILNLCKKTFIHGYDFSDLKNECYKSLFYCISKYNLETHRFVAYATNGIKNNIYDLVRKSQTRKSLDSSETLIITDEFQETLVSDLIGIEDFLCKKSDYIELHKAIKKLNADEQEMINFLFFSKSHDRKTIKEYSDFKNISYHCAVKRRKMVLKKLSKALGSICCIGICLIYTMY